MDTIIRKDGFVYLVKEDSNDGRFKTYYNLGKDPDLMDAEEKPKKGKTKKDED